MAARRARARDRHQRRADPGAARPASAAPTCTSTTGTPGRSKTIPVPMVVGHEFVGEVVEVGANVNDFHAGDLVSGEGHVVCGRCRNCLAGRRHLCARHQGRRRQPARRVRRVHRAADDQRLASRARRSTATSPRSSIRSATPCTPRSSFPVLGEDVLITGAGPDRHDGGGGRRGTPARATSSSPTSTRTGSSSRETMGATRAVDVRSDTDSRDVQKRARHEGGLRRRPRDVGQRRARFRDMLANMSHGGRIAHARHPRRGDRDRLEQGRSSTCSRSRASTAARCTRPGTR